MIKKTVVCDRCEKGKPYVIIPKSNKLASNTVLCRECAECYYDLDCSPKCTNCGISIVGNPCCKTGCDLFCSRLCAIKYCEGHSGNDEQMARYFTDEDEKMLICEYEQ